MAWSGLSVCLTTRAAVPQRKRERSATAGWTTCWIDGATRYDPRMCIVFAFKVPLSPPQNIDIKRITRKDPVLRTRSWLAFCVSVFSAPPHHEKNLQNTALERTRVFVLRARSGIADRLASPSTRVLDFRVSCAPARIDFGLSERM